MTQAHLVESLVAASSNTSLLRGHVGRWERGLHIPGPFWRSWLAFVLGLTREQLEHAIVVQEHFRLQSELGIDTPLPADRAPPPGRPPQPPRRRQHEP